MADDEVGHALFALLALADSLEIQAGEAVEDAIAKYEERMAQ